MDKKSNILPIVIILSLVILVGTVVLIKMFAPGLFENEQNGIIMGSQSSETSIESQTETTKISTLESSALINQTEDIPVLDKIELDMLYTRTLSFGEPDKVEFSTVDIDSDYRFCIKTKIDDSPLQGNLVLAIYDERGIKVDDYSFTPRYDNSPYYCDETFFDLHLESEKTYTYKVSSDSASGQYQLSVLRMERDAGSSESSATHISVNEEITAILNSTLSDWYVCNIQEAGTYEIVVHNIDIGCKVDVIGRFGESSVFQAYVSNEDSESRTFRVYQPCEVVIEINSMESVANGKYIMSINKLSD